MAVEAITGITTIHEMETVTESPFYIPMTGQAARPRRTLKHDDTFIVLDGHGDIGAPRRELQREYINRVSAMLLRPSPSGRADARSLVRSRAQALLPRLVAASGRSGLSADARAHLKDGADTLSQALSARLLRSGL